MNQPKSSRAWVESLMQTAFDRPRDPRSDEYKRGVRAVLELRFLRTPIPRLYQPGTASDDAYHSGMQEGHRIWREHLEAHKGVAA
jgi:hypothetical protein